MGGVRNIPEALSLSYKVLVTGGAGFVGRHLIHALLDLGHEVHCVDPIAQYTGGIHPNRGWRLFNPNDYGNFKFYGQDCRIFFRQRSDTDFDYCYHLAAMVGGRLMIENKPLAVADDLSIDAEFWQWAAAVRPSKIACFSSSAAYPIALQRRGQYVLLKEDMITFDNHIGMPDMSYGWAKLTNEYMARLAHERYGLKSIVYRPFSGYGEDQDLTYPFPSICKRVVENRNEAELKVWGSGNQMRDFIHISDCVAGILKTIDTIEDAAALNLSTGILTTFKELAASAARLAGYNPLVMGTSEKPEGVFARGGDTTKQKSLGFSAKVTLREGIQKGLDYFSDIVFGRQ